MSNDPQRRPRPPRREPVTDIEKFLMEVERLRRKERQPVDDVEVVDEVEVVQPAAPPPPRPRPRPVETPRFPPPVSEVRPVRPVPAPPPPAPPALAQPTTSITRFGAGISLPVLQVVQMLRSRQHARTAIILNEILGPPVSRRRR